MAFSRLSTSRIGNGLPKYPNAWDQTTVWRPAPTGAYESIATTTVGAGGVSSITFSGIPSGYTHLQLRTFSATSNPGDPVVQFNGDTGTNYSSHLMYGPGGGVGAYSPGGSATSMLWLIGNNPSVANAYGVAILDIFDYTNSNKYKTSRALFAYDNNGTGQVNFASGLWMSTSPITSITITVWIRGTSSGINNILQDGNFDVCSVP